MKMWHAAVVLGLTLTAPAAGAEINWNDARQFWSFRPVQKPALPAVKDAGWAKTDIDRFILARLEKRD